MIAHLDLGWMLLLVGIGLFVIAIVIAIVIDSRRFEQWAKRDKELMQKWNAAFDSRDYNECRRLQALMHENLQSYRAKA